MIYDTIASAKRAMSFDTSAYNSLWMINVFAAVIFLIAFVQSAKMDSLLKYILYYIVILYRAIPIDKTSWEFSENVIEGVS